MFLVNRNARYLEELVTHLLRNCSRPCRRSSIKESSNIPSSPRNGSCLIRAFPGRGGTTTYLKYKIFIHVTYISMQSQVSYHHFKRHYLKYRIISNPMIEKALLLNVSSWNGPLQHGRMIKCPTLSIHAPCYIQTNTVSFTYTLPCFLSPALLSATQSRCISSGYVTPSAWR